MATSKIDSDLKVNGHLSATTMTIAASSVSNASITATADIARSKLAQDVLAVYPINMTDWRTWDAMATNLPGTSANDDLGLDADNFGTDSPFLTTLDFGGNGAAAHYYARALRALPAEYDDGQTVQIRVSGGMITTVADTTATVDFVVYKSDREMGIGADLCATAAQSINSLTFADKDFTITSSALAAGDVLDVRIDVAVEDTGDAGVMKAALGAVELLCDIRG